jgi:hypothetical protein
MLVDERGNRQMLSGPGLSPTSHVLLGHVSAAISLPK